MKGRSTIGGLLMLAVTAAVVAAAWTGGVYLTNKAIAKQQAAGA